MQDKLIFKLPSARRPLLTESFGTVHPERSNFENEWASRRTVDPLRGIRAIVLKLPQSEAEEDWFPSHHLISVSPPDGESRPLSLVNESMAVRGLDTSTGHPDVFNGLSEPNQWSVFITIVPVLAGDGIVSYDHQQIRTAAGLIRQCWRRYPNLRYIVGAPEFTPDDPATSASVTFPWSQVRDAVFGN